MQPGRFVAGRLKRGIALQEAQAEFDTIVSSMRQAYPEMRDWGIHLVTFFLAGSIHDHISG